MSPRFTFIFGVVLLLFPLLKVYTVWLQWVAFAIGLYFVVCVLYEILREK